MSSRTASLRLALLALLALSVASCGGDDAPPADTDSGLPDAAPADAGPSDAARPDAAQDDAGPRDAGDVDAFVCPDLDGDGHADAACGGDDCDDSDVSRYPGATEVCDGDDEDCDDATYGADADADGDTFASALCCNGAGNCGSDCDDTDVNVNPDATEVCNGGIDDDCNGLADLADGVCVACPTGYSGFDGSCTNVDECAAGAPCGSASGAVCTDSAGSYSCACPSGYIGETSGGTCTDTDECALGAPCGAAALACTNTVGSYQCGCGVGYAAPASGGTCVNVDECATAAQCGRAVGGGGGNGCADTTGGYTCTCGAGFVASGAGITVTCVDVNECTTGTDDCCDVPDACVNTSGGFTCVCPAGFVGTGHGLASCSPRFTDLLDGTVRDNSNGLVWQRAVDAGDYSQAGAIAYCASLTLAGGGWRLPTKDELLSIVDTRFWPTIDSTYFPGTPVSWYWSSSSAAGSPSSGWYVYFGDGYAGYVDATATLRARCVR